MRKLTTENIVGSLLAGAIGDAWGAAYEGGRGPSTVGDLPVGAGITDDTQMTLATCAAIERGRVDPEAIAAGFLAAYQRRELRGLGSATLQALKGLEVGGHWSLVGARGERAAGNGAAMRIAPLAFLLDPTDREDRTKIRDVCRITHHSDEAYVGALAMVVAIRQAWSSGALNLGEIASALPDSKVRDQLQRLASLGGGSVASAVEEVGNGGNVAESVPLALLAASIKLADTLESLVRDLVAAGGDTDTTSSMAGQVWGAARGVKAMPREQFRRLEGAESIEAAAVSFAKRIIREKCS